LAALSGEFRFSTSAENDLLTALRDDMVQIEFREYKFAPNSIQREEFDRLKQRITDNPDHPLFVGPSLRAELFELLREFRSTWGMVALCFGLSLFSILALAILDGWFSSSSIRWLLPIPVFFIFAGAVQFWGVFGSVASLLLFRRKRRRYWERVSNLVQKNPDYLAFLREY
jgi:hypothetical protein